MPEQRHSQDRALLLADVAEMYYLEEKGQAEIARAVGVTRSMVSRMLKEAREKGLVEVRVQRPLQSDRDLETALTERFGLREAVVVRVASTAKSHLLHYLGSIGAQAIKRHLEQEIVLGLSWGTAVSAVVDALDVDRPLAVKVVQLVGALGARNTEYDGHALVLRLTEKLGGEGYFLNAPFLCPTAEMASALLENQGIKETVNLGRQAQVALLGVGSTSLMYSGYYLSGYVPLEEMNQLLMAGAVGNVCGIHFGLDGQETCLDFCERLVSIRKPDLFAIPVRLGVAGGPGKVEPIVGALRGGYINILVTDGITARRVLDLADKD
jgi:deoxyribonucleoside regulator